MFYNLIEFVFHEGGKVANEVSNYDVSGDENFYREIQYKKE